MHETARRLNVFPDTGSREIRRGTALQPACFGYDEADRMTSLTTFRAGTETISGDPSDRTDGDTTTWAYHAATGLELRKTYADGSSTVKTYDAFNRLSTETSARGLVATYAYETARGLLTGISYSDTTPGIAYSYNHLGMLIQVTDAAGTRSFGYNTYGEAETDSLVAGEKTHLITELRDSLGRSVGYTYAKDGAVQQTVGTSYSTDGRITGAGFLHGGELKEFTYTYVTGSHLLQGLTMPNNMALALSYEAQRDLLTGMVYTRGTTTVVQRGYSYDALGRPLTRAQSRQGSTRNDSFVHNDRSELTAATLGTDAYAYAYDNIGNRLTTQEAEEQTAYTANNLNQYTAIQEGEAEAFAPTYDADGNQTLVKTSTGIWTVTYNAVNRPVVFANEATGTVVECSYDSSGRRATKKVTVNGTVTLHQRYIYRGYLQISCCDLTRTAHPCLWLITWDPTQPVATRPLAIQKDGTWYTYGFDLTKNVTEVFTTIGYIGTAYTYTPYGEVSASGNITQPIQWSSEYHDVELGLVYYNYRHYNSVDGRWLRRDPAFWNFNVYLMMPPTVNVDHLGLRTVSKKKKCCPERVVVEYDNQIYDDKLEEIDRENIKGWLQQDRHDKINDLALIPEQRAKYGVFPYGLLHSELSMEKLEQLFEGHNSLLAELIRVRKRLKIRTNHTGQPGKFGYHGFIRRGLLTVRFPEKSKCKPFSFRIQAGGRASGFLPEELQTTAPLPGSGYIYQKGNQGIIAGYPIGMGEDPKAGVWGEQREGIMIHLAPATGYGERRQIGSHGCISTHDETGWRRFVEAMSGCSKIPIYIIQG